MRISDWSSDVCSSDLNNVLATVARADGEPLNGTDIPGIFEGSFDGNGRAITNSTDKWYPRGTVRAGVIWRSGPPPAYDQTFINTHLPRYDVTIGYASHTHYSNNGRSEEHTSELQSLMRISYAVFCLIKKNNT